MNISNFNDLATALPRTPETVKANNDPPAIQKSIMGDAAVLTPGEVVEIVQKANAALQSNQSNLKFMVDPDSGQQIVQVVDKETEEVLRQIPSVEMLKIAKAIEKMQGVLMSTQA
ncbi:MAG TPA: flagellar protein FlaG [Limnobacter sp.]|uniref:flagellar protein FlaG n=1 Tax=Limnobacter sp. TaxID=2003368 RepID=UPI002EDA120D